MVQKRSQMINISHYKNTLTENKSLITHVILFFLMFTVYFLMGTSMITLVIYMNEAGMKDLIIYAVASFPLSMVISPLLSGAIADRYFSANKMIATCFIISGLLLCTAVSFSSNPLIFVILFFIFKLVYAPTLGLANSITMANVENIDKSFPIIRIGGTLGWIFAAAIISLLKAETTSTPFLISGTVAVVLGIIFMFILPHTPPAEKNSTFNLRDIIGVDAIKSLNVKGNGFKVFMTTCFFATLLSSLYDQYAPLYFHSSGLERTAAYMALGQVSEVLIMFLLPILSLRFKLKNLMIFGLLAIILRYALLLTNTYIPHIYLAISAIAMHGFIIALYFIVSQIVMDMLANKEIRSQAQSLLMFVSLGAGSLLGSIVMGSVLNLFVKDVNDMAQWRVFWLIPLAVSIFTALLFIYGFKNKNLENTKTSLQ